MHTAGSVCVGGRAVQAVCRVAERARVGTHPRLVSEQVLHLFSGAVRSGLPPLAISAAWLDQRVSRHPIKLTQCPLLAMSSCRRKIAQRFMMCGDPGTSEDRAVHFVLRLKEVE